MKAAVLHQLGEAPKYEDFNDPIPQDNQLLLEVKASSVKNLDKARVAGTHYANYSNFPTTVGIDGVGILENGKKVYAQGITGMIAEKALISADNYLELPDHIDYETAAALPNAVLGSAMALLLRAKIEAGQNILINGATGVTGMIAVQLAKHYGADKIYVTGRNEEQLQKALKFGATKSISLHLSNEDFIKEISQLHTDNHIDIVLDYLWGHPVEMILKALKGHSVNHDAKKVKIVTVGEMAGATINLPSGLLRSSDIEILGSGFGSLTPTDIAYFNKHILPQMFELAAKGDLTIETDVEPLSDIEKVWDKKVGGGKRLVIKIAD